MNNIFVEKQAPKLRSQTDLFAPQIRTVHYGEDSLRYLGPKIWNGLPDDIKESPTLELFKANIKKWVPKCPCRLCKDYVKGLGFVTLFE